MKERTLEDARCTIKNLDERTLDDRASRLMELGVTHYSSIERSTSQLMSDYSVEAAKNFVEGCFRSCIFCCAAAVDQTFRHEIIYASKNPEEKFDKLRRKTFGQIIDLAKNTVRLQPFQEDACWLNRLRNKLAVHSLSFWPLRGDYIKEIKVIKQGLKEIITVVDAEDREKIKQLLIRVSNLDTSDALDILMWRPDEDSLKSSALKAHNIMARIIEGLYPSSQI
jgi:hypothetical protein